MLTTTPTRPATTPGDRLPPADGRYVGLDVLDVVPTAMRSRPGPLHGAQPRGQASGEPEIGRPSTYATISARSRAATTCSRRAPRSCTDLARLRRDQAARGALRQPRRLRVHRRHGADARRDRQRRRRPQVRCRATSYFGTEAPGDEGLRSRSPSSATSTPRRFRASGARRPRRSRSVSDASHGTYIETGDGRRANVPEDLPPDELTADYAHQLLDAPAIGRARAPSGPDTKLPGRREGRPLRPLCHRGASRGRARQGQGGGQGAHGVAVQVDEHRARRAG